VVLEFNVLHLLHLHLAVVEQAFLVMELQVNMLMEMLLVHKVVTAVLAEVVVAALQTLGLETQTTQRAMAAMAAY
jgi:hypothetical protein